MILIYILLLSIVLLILYMIKVANEHHILQHEVKLIGHEESLRIVFISDVHNRLIRSRGFDEIGQVDAVIIGGDFCDRRTSFSKMKMNLQLLSTLGPIYFVWGNNDREIGEKGLREMFKKHRVTIVENDAVELVGYTNRTWVAAIDDTSTKNYDFSRALDKCANEDVTICVSHNPQVFHLARQQKRISLLLGGHLHGGQIRLGKLGLHPNGSFSIRHGVATLISNGYGTTLLPLRLGAKPQLHVVTMNIKES